MSHQLIYITLTVVLALTFQPLRRLFEKLTDSIFFRDRYDSQTVLNEIGDILTSERQLDTLMPRVLTVICRNVRLNSGRFIVLEHAKIEKVHYYGQEDSSPLTFADLESLGEQTLITDKLESNNHKLHLLQAHNLGMSVPLRVRKQRIGYLLLGNKRSGSTYSREDRNLIEVTAPGLAVATSNAKAFDQIDEFNKTLQEEILKATHSLRVANKNLKALDKTKDEFLSIASHQLRTPLATIEGCLSMLNHGDLGQISTKQTRFMQTAIDAATNMSAIVTQIIDISTVSAGRFLISKKPEDLNEIVVHKVEELQPIAQAKGLELRYIPPTYPLPLMELDKAKLQQAIANFIDNAINYTEKGRIIVMLQQVDNEARFTVTDTGIGVPRSEQPKMFDRFFRASNARNLRPDGSGLGLYLAREVVTAQGGRFIFKSREGEGSTFGFAIPISVRTVADAANVTPRQAVAH